MSGSAGSHLALLSNPFSPLFASRWRGPSMGALSPASSPPPFSVARRKLLWVDLSPDQAGPEGKPDKSLLRLLQSQPENFGPFVLRVLNGHEVRSTATAEVLGHLHPGPSVSLSLLLSAVGFIPLLSSQAPREKNLLSSHPHSYLHPPIPTAIHPSTHLSTHQYAYLPSHLLIRPTNHPSIYPSPCAFIHITVHPFIHPPTHTHTSIPLSIHLLIHPSSYPPTHPQYYWRPACGRQHKAVGRELRFYLRRQY